VSEDVPFVSVAAKSRGKNDMNTDIDDSDCIVVQKGGGKVRKRSVEVVGSPDPPNADASALSPEAGERVEDGRGG
jgi:hypothetical protein